MQKTEIQESQKTVIAFVAGLLIGGLLVWVFGSSSSEPTVVPENGDDTMVTQNEAAIGAAVTGTQSALGNTVTATAVAPSGNASMSALNQAAGETVTITVNGYPAAEGWVVVRDFDDGVATGILGAARYNLADALLPSEVELLRATEAGHMYQVIFYTEDGDRVFDTENDVPVVGTGVAFTAE